MRDRRRARVLELKHITSMKRKENEWLPNQPLETRANNQTIGSRAQLLPNARFASTSLVCSDMAA